MPTMDEYRSMQHSNNDVSKADVFVSGRRRGNEKFLRGGLKMDLLFITGEYSGVVVRFHRAPVILQRLTAHCCQDTDNDGILEEHERIPPEFICPITTRIMTVPVKASDGATCVAHTLRCRCCCGFLVGPSDAVR